MLVKHYGKAFKERAVKLSYEIENISAPSRKLGISDSILGQWRIAFEKFGDKSFPGKGNERLSDEQRRIRDLEKQLADRELDLDILKKSIGLLNKFCRHSTIQVKLDSTRS